MLQLLANWSGKGKLVLFTHCFFSRFPVVLIFSVFYRSLDVAWFILEKILKSHAMISVTAGHTVQSWCWSPVYDISQTLHDDNFCWAVLVQIIFWDWLYFKIIKAQSCTTFLRCHSIEFRLSSVVSVLYIYIKIM